MLMPLDFAIPIFHRSIVMVHRDRCSWYRCRPPDGIMAGPSYSWFGIDAREITGFAQIQQGGSINANTEARRIVKLVRLPERSVRKVRRITFVSTIRRPRLSCLGGAHDLIALLKVENRSKI